MLFPKSTIDAYLYTVLKTYNQSNIEQLGVNTLRLRYKDKTARCRTFGGLVLLGIPDIELLGILQIMCEAVGCQQADRKFDS